MNTATSEKLLALLRERDEQNRQLAEAEARLIGLGEPVVNVPRAALEAIHAACLVGTETLSHSAIRA